MSDFVKVADLSEIPDPGKRLFELDDHLVVVFHAGGQVYCLEDLCTHDGGPLGELSEAALGDVLQKLIAELASLLVLVCLIYELCCFMELLHHVCTTVLPQLSLLDFISPSGIEMIAVLEKKAGA